METKDKASILVVDDQLDIRILSKRILESHGYQVLLAEDGLIALDILSEQHVDLIVADIAMPNLNGYQLFKRISEHTEWAHIPFILLSARDLDSDIRYGKSLGVDDYITKPFEPADLLASVRGRLLRAEQLASCDGFPGEIRSNSVKYRQVQAFNQDLNEPVLNIDVSRQLVRHCGCEIQLSTREFSLFVILHHNRHRVVPMQELIGVTHGYKTTKNQASNLLRPLVRSIRRKLGYEVGENGCIRNVRGVGYQYVDYQPQINMR